MARKDAMVKPGQQQKRGSSNSKLGEEKEASKDTKKTSSTSTPTGLMRSDRQSTSKGKGSSDSSYLSSDPNFAAFKKRLESIGLELRDIIGDGNCLFRALGDQLDGSDRDHLKHREDVVRYMLKHENDFAPFVEDDVPFAKHIDELRQPGTFGGNDCIVAFARCHKVTVIIHQLDAPAIEIKGADDYARQLHISYHNGDHYSSVRRINDSTNKPVNIRLTPIAADGNPKQSNSVKPQKNVPSSSDFTDLDTVNHVIERTGCEDVELVKTSLADNDYDIDLAIDSVKAVLTFARSGSAASSNGGSDGEDEKPTSSTAGDQLKLPQKGRSQQMRMKKAEKKLRRMQERREQYLVSKGGSSTESDSKSAKVDQSSSDVIVINSAKLNIVTV